ncbi:MAG: glycosyltransferase family 39 protein, partial [Angustibacter sp.]
IRLNNGASASASLISLALGAVVWAVVLWKHDDLRPETVGAALYGLGLALLLMTALRGWGITGHDIQREFERFSVVQQAGLWNMETFRDPYNACLSITILPTIIANATGLSPILVLKVLPQLIFALSPVLIYLISRKFLSGRTSVLAALLFCSFPTYFNDMPFLGRQGIAFIFLALVLYSIADRGSSRRVRRVLFVGFGAGVVVSHYATTYVLLAIVLVALLAGRILGRVATRFLGDRAELHVLTPATVAILLAITFAWSQVITDTNSQLSATISTSFTELVSGQDSGDRSNDTAYNLLGGAKVTPEQRLADYRAASLARTAAGRSTGEFLPRSQIDRVETPAVEAQVLALTGLGRQVDRVVDVARAHEILRAAAARAFQIFIFIGLLGFVLSARRRARLTLEWFVLALGSLLAVISQVLLPQVSVDYGVLRAFAQSLFVLSPFL